MKTASTGIVAVTGGAGFLGQHIVKHLHQCPLFTKIRVIDFQDYQQKLDFVPMKPVEVVKGDICNYEEVQSALQGVHTVIHTAGLIDVSMFPDAEKLQRINVHGTQNIIAACIKCNVESMVYTSTMDVVVGFNDIKDGNETLKTPAHLLWGEYAQTKLVAEKSVCNAEGSLLANGSQLKTAVLRPTVMYGEGDPHFVTQGLKVATQCFGMVPRVGNGRAKLQATYAGNTAWAHIKAAEALMDKKSDAGGQAFFVTDDSPITDTQGFIEKFLVLRGYSMSNLYIPLFALLWLLFLIELLAKCLRPIWNINSQFFTLKSMRQLNTTVTLTRKKAEKYIRYKPIYSFKESFEASAEYYKSIN